MLDADVEGIEFFLSRGSLDKIGRLFFAQLAALTVAEIRFPKSECSKRFS